MSISCPNRIFSNRPNQMWRTLVTFPAQAFSSYCLEKQELYSYSHFQDALCLQFSHQICEKTIAWVPFCLVMRYLTGRAIACLRCLPLFVRFQQFQSELWMNDWQIRIQHQKSEDLFTSIQSSLGKLHDQILPFQTWSQVNRLLCVFFLVCSSNIYLWPR